MQKAKDRYHNSSGKGKAEWSIANKDVLRKNAKIYTETCQKKKKKQKQNMEEIDMKTWHDMKKQTKRITKKISNSKPIKY